MSDGIASHIDITTWVPRYTILAVLAVLQYEYHTITAYFDMGIALYSKVHLNPYIRF
jgi:hypothetical protein